MTDERDKIIIDLKNQVDLLQNEYNFVKDVSDRLFDRLYSVMNNSHQTLIVFFDKNLQAEDFNNGFFELLGYNENQLNDSFHQYNLTVLTDLLKRFIAIGKQRKNSHIETALLNASGKKVEFNIYLSKIINPVNEETGYLALGYDVTLQKKMKLKLENSNRLLISKNFKIEEANRYKTEFLNNITHELRTPLSGVIGVIKLIRGFKIVHEPLERNIQIIENNSKNLLAIINQLLDISRIEAGKMNINYSKLPIGMLSFDAEMLANPLLHDKPSVIFRTDIKNPEQQILTDHGKLRQIITNLIGNAVKFTHQGEICFSVRVNENRLEMSIKDTGIGIAKADLKRIFLPFVQADGSITRQYGGTGLGLTITNRLVKLLNGQISIRSTVGQGSEFILSFKLKQLEKI